VRACVNWPGVGLQMCVSLGPKMAQKGDIHQVQDLAGWTTMGLHLGAGAADCDAEVAKPPYRVSGFCYRCLAVTAMR
jgi:hypothetical protein